MRHPVQAFAAASQAHRGNPSSKFGRILLAIACAIESTQRADHEQSGAPTDGAHGGNGWPYLLSYDQGGAWPMLGSFCHSADADHKGWKI